MNKYMLKKCREILRKKETSLKEALEILDIMINEKNNQLYIDFEEEE